MSEEYRQAKFQMADDDRLQPFRQLRSVAELDRGGSLTRAILATVREPLAILDGDLRVIEASISFCRLFQIKHVQGRLLWELGDGQWDIPILRWLLEAVISSDTVIEGHEVELDVPDLGRRLMLLNARRTPDGQGPGPALLITLEDITAPRQDAALNALLQKQQETLLLEVQHRVSNSLQIVASILMLKARTVQSEETRTHLRDAHQRVVSLATLQQQLRMSALGDRIDVGPYLTSLCASLARSMIADDRDIAVTATVTSAAAIVKAIDAVSYGLIVTELVINALKHGFPDGRKGHISVAFAGEGDDWCLSVSDDGVGQLDKGSGPKHIGLGTSIVEALARNLKARVDVVQCNPGTATSIIHAAKQDAATELPTP